MGEEEAGAGVEAEAEKDGTVETDEETADVRTGATEIVLLSPIISFRRFAATTAAGEVEGDVTSTSHKHTHCHGIEIGIEIVIETGTGIDSRNCSRLLFPAAAIIILWRTVIFAVILEGTGVVVVVTGGGLKVVVCVGVGAMAGTRSSALRVVALATATALATIVSAKEGVWAAAGATAELGVGVLRDSLPHRWGGPSALRTSSPLLWTTSKS